jgi:uroporphyrinogen-III synthase
MKHLAQAKSLKGRTILITRQREQSGELIALIEERGGKACVIPMIRILDPESWDRCDEALARLASYDGLILTSGNAVEKLFMRCKAKNISGSTFKNMEVYAVGERTAELSGEFGVEATFTPKEFSSAWLLERFSGERVEGKQFLFPRGNLTKEELPSHLRSLGAVVDEVDVYCNAPPSAETLEELNARFLTREFDVVTFASPSALRSFRKAVIPGLFDLVTNHTLLAVIGPTTRLAAESLGYRVDIEAHVATGKGLVDAISLFYSRQ